MKYYIFVCALLIGVHALNAMDIEMGKISSKQKRQKVTLSELKSSVGNNNLDLTINLIKKIKVTPKTDSFVRNFEEWFNHKANIYTLKKLQGGKFAIVASFSVAAAALIILSFLSVNTKGLGFIILGIMLFSGAVISTIGTTVSIVNCYKNHKNIIHYTPNKEKIDIIISQLKQIHLIIKQEQTKKELKENGELLEKLTNTAH